MVIVRYATLVALVVWLAAMTGARFGDLFRQPELIGLAAGATMLVGLIVQKFVGPPPHQFFARAGIAALMLAVAAGALARVARDAAPLLTTVNVALGLVLLAWYVRE